MGDWVRGETVEEGKEGDVPSEDCCSKGREGVSCCWVEAGRNVPGLRMNPGSALGGSELDEIGKLGVPLGWDKVAICVC